MAWYVDLHTLLASRPSGTNWMNYKVSVRAMLPANATSVSGGSDPYTVLCGRISIWPLRDEQLKGMPGSPPVGVCLVLASNSGWRLEERDNHKNKLLVRGVLPRAATRDSIGDISGTWHNLSLAFDGDQVRYTIDSSVGAVAKVTSMNGVAGFGSGFHHAFFVSGSFVLAAAPSAPAETILFFSIA